MKNKEKNSKRPKLVMKKYVKIASRDDNHLTLFISTMFEVARDQGITVEVIRISE